MILKGASLSDGCKVDHWINSTRPFLIFFASIFLKDEKKSHRKKFSSLRAKLGRTKKRGGEVSHAEKWISVSRQIELNIDFYDRFTFLIWN